MNRKPGLSIYSVAEHCGVSPSTVSRVINGNPRIGKDTVDRVCDAMRELGYQPMEQRLRRGPKLRQAGPGKRTRRIALLAAGESRAQLKRAAYLDFLHGVESAIAEAGLTMVLRQLFPGIPVPTPLFQQRVDGVVLFSADPGLRRGLWNLPHVQGLGPFDPNGQWDHISYANSRIGPIAAAHLLSLGHRHTAFLSGIEQISNTFAERRESFASAIREAGGTCLMLEQLNLFSRSTDAFIQPDQDRVSELLDRLLAASPRPTAVFLAADVIAPSFYNAMRNRGLTPMKDLAIVSCNNEQPLIGHLQPRLSTIDIHAERVGRKAVEQLLWRMENPGDPRIVVSVEPSLVPGTL